jgi:Ring finger domain
MSRCPGCFPNFQPNQMAHMERGGCMYVDDLEEISMISETTLSSVHNVESTSLNDETMSEEECCICYENIGKKNNCVTECGHKFCFKCLATAMTRSNACPCCRQPLIDEPAAEEDEEDSEYDEDDDEDDASDISDEDDDSSLVPIELIAERLERNGFTMLDMVSMFMGGACKANEKYTPLHMDALYAKCDIIVDEARKEIEEAELFAQEDTRA